MQGPTAWWGVSELGPPSPGAADLPTSAFSELLASLGFLGLLNRLGSSPPLGLGFCSFLSLECSFPRTSPSGSFSLFRSQLEHHPLPEVLQPPCLAKTSPGILYPMSSLCFLLGMCNCWSSLLNIFFSMFVVGLLPPNAAREGCDFAWPCLPDGAPASAQCLTHSKCPINNS